MLTRTPLDTSILKAQTLTAYYGSMRRCPETGWGPELEPELELGAKPEPRLGLVAATPQIAFILPWTSVWPK